jgi:hypothetical protein
MERGAVVSHEEDEEEQEPDEEPRPTLSAIPAYEEPKPATRSAQRSAPKAAPKSAAKPAAKTAPKTAAKTAPKSAAKAAPKKRTVAMVVVVPDRDKYHKESCRYANNPAAIELTKAQARRQGYEPCATCKP